MSQNTQWDSLDYDVLNFPYNRIETEFSPEPRVFRGQNSYVTRGGKLAKRPGTVNLDTNNTIAGGRIDRLWNYETLEASPSVFLVASVFTGTYWELRYKKMESTTVNAWATPTAYRDCNLSTRPHELCVSRGLAYIKGFPRSASSEKLGTIILDGTGGTMTVKPWGILGPDTPAAVTGAMTTLAGGITATDLSFNVVSAAGFPATPFFIQIGFEQMKVTTVATNTFTVTRGANGTTAVAHSARERVIYLNWNSSDHLIEVNFGWTYSYAYKSITGQVSNRADIQRNPDKLPSNTGPFFDLIPKITVQGHADTTNIPTICIYRTTDGGGTFYKLKEIPNTGAGAITYTDDSRASGAGGGTFKDPQPDSALDQFDIAPSRVSNSPPPAVLAPLETGVATPAASTPIVSFQARLWYAIGNILFFSAQEELNEGIPEESFPSGERNGRGGNFFRFQYPIVNLAETANALYVFTIQATYRLTGNNLETFNFTTAFENMGAPTGHPRAIARHGEAITFLTHDYRICQIEQDQIVQISDPLWTDLVDQLNQNSEFDLKYFGDLDKEWIIVSSHRKNNTTISGQWIFDIRKSRETRKPFWFTPWTLRSVASLSARASNASSQRRLIFAVYDEATNASGLVRLDPTGRTGTDYFFGTSAGFTFNVEFHQMTVPAGNHVNGLRAPAATPTVYAVDIDRVLFTDDEDPDMYWYFDDLWTDPVQSPRTENPPRRPLSKGYKTLHYTIHQICQHFSVRISKINSTDLFELMRLTVVWNPDAGA